MWRKACCFIVVLIALLNSSSVFAELDADGGPVYDNSVSQSSVRVGDIGMWLLDGSELNERNVFSALLEGAWECNDWNLQNALLLWKPNETVKEIDFLQTDDSNGNNERYVFSVHVEDAVVDNYYIISFDYWISDEVEGGEYYNCDIQSVSTGFKLGKVTWRSREAKGIYFESDNRPDGQFAITAFLYIDISSDPWIKNYVLIPSYSSRDEWNEYSYGYKFDCGTYIQDYILYPDASIYDIYLDRFYYLEGVEEQINAIALTSGNELGCSSTNLFNGGEYALEGDILVFTKSHGVYRSTLDHQSEMCLYSGLKDYPESLNLIDGECYFCNYDGAYGVDLNGTELIRVYGIIGGIIADNSNVFYTVYRGASDTKEGLYSYDKKTGMTVLLSDQVAKNIAIDGEWIYFDDSLGRYIYRIKKDGTSLKIVEKNKSGKFIVQDGVLLFYDYDNTDLYMRNISVDNGVSNPVFIAEHSKFGGRSNYSGNENTRKVALHDGWLYYYYANDTSMICRMSLDGMIIDEFVCYSDWAIEGIYFFGDDLYLAGKEGIYYKTTVLSS